VGSNVLLVTQFRKLQFIATDGKLCQPPLHCHSGNLTQLIQVALVKLHHQFFDVCSGSGYKLIDNQINIGLEQVFGLVA